MKPKFSSTPLELYFDITEGANLTIINRCLKKLLKLSNIEIDVNFDKNKTVYFNNYDKINKSNFKDLILLVNNFKIGARLKGLAINILRKLDKSFSESQHSQFVISNLVIFNILNDILDFSFLISNLNPVSISSSKIPISIKQKNKNYAYDIDIKAWMLKLVQDVPIFEAKDKYCDPIVIAMLTVVCSSFGSSITSRLKQSASVFDKKLQLRVIIMLFLPKEISTRIIDSQILHKNTNKQLEIKAILNYQSDLNNLLYLIEQAGVFNVFTSQILHMDCLKHLLIIYINESNRSKIMEILFLSGEVTYLYFSNVECKELLHKTVAVPYGDGKKLKSCRVNEWYYNNKLVKIEIHKYDLDILLNNKNNLESLVRASIINSWKDWRKNFT